MKFLVKDKKSPLASAGLTYNKGRNSTLRDALVGEQKGYCAYTEKRFSGLDQVNVEHFDDDKKPGNDHAPDDYFNVYATLSSANQRKRKKRNKHRGASFFAADPFFQRAGGFDERIVYQPDDHVYEERRLDDTEARDFIDYLSFNERILADVRRKHVQRIHSLRTDNGWSDEQLLAYLDENPEELSFVTALELTLGVALQTLIDKHAPGFG